MNDLFSGSNASVSTRKFFIVNSDFMNWRLKRFSRLFSTMFYISFSSLKSLPETLFNLFPFTEYNFILLRIIGQCVCSFRQFLIDIDISESQQTAN